MSTMQKALVKPTSDAPPEVRLVPIPEPAADQVLVKLVTTALMPADWKIPAFGIYPADEYPIVFGYDGAGVVERVGDQVDPGAFKKGDRVIVQGWDVDGNWGKKTHGTFQEYIAAPADVVAKIPDFTTYEEGATLFSGVATIANSLYAHMPGTESLKFPPPWEAGGVGACAGKSFLVVGGSSQIGQFAIQFANLSGFNPIIATASPRHTSTLTALGATHVLDRSLPPAQILARVHAILGTSGKSNASSGGTGVDVAYDAITDRDTLALAVSALKPGAEGGRLVFVLDAAAIVADLPEAREKGLVDSAVRAGGLQSLRMNRGALAGLWAKLGEFLEKGWVKPTEYEILPGGLHGIPGGLERLRKNEVSGVKLVARLAETA